MFHPDGMCVCVLVCLSSKKTEITGRRLVRLMLATRCLAFAVATVISIHHRISHRFHTDFPMPGICTYNMFDDHIFRVYHRHATQRNTHTQSTHARSFYYRKKREVHIEEENEELKAATWLIDGFAYCTWSMLITTTAPHTHTQCPGNHHTTNHCFSIVSTLMCACAFIGMRCIMQTTTGEQNHQTIVRAGSCNVMSESSECASPAVTATTWLQCSRDEPTNK